MIIIDYHYFIQLLLLHLFILYFISFRFLYSYHASYVSSMAYSSPSIVIDAGRTADGRRVMYDDYREAYFWLRQNTHPGKNRVLHTISHSLSTSHTLSLSLTLL